MDEIAAWTHGALLWAGHGLYALYASGRRAAVRASPRPRWTPWAHLSRRAPTPAPASAPATAKAAQTCATPTTPRYPGHWAKDASSPSARVTTASSRDAAQGHEPTQQMSTPSPSNTKVTPQADDNKLEQQPAQSATLRIKGLRLKSSASTPAPSTPLKTSTHSRGARLGDAAHAQGTRSESLTPASGASPTNEQRTRGLSRRRHVTPPSTTSATDDADSRAVEHATALASLPHAPTDLPAFPAPDTHARLRSASAHTRPPSIDDAAHTAPPTTDLPARHDATRASAPSVLSAQHTHVPPAPSASARPRPPAPATAAAGHTRLASQHMPLGTLDAPPPPPTKRARQRGPSALPRLRRTDARREPSTSARLTRARSTSAEHAASGSAAPRPPSMTAPRPPPSTASPPRRRSARNL